MPAPCRAVSSWPLRRRLGMRLGGGMSAREAARTERLAPAEMEALLAQPEFAQLVAAYRKLASLSPERRIARLKALAWMVLEMALADGDVRVAMFVAAEIARARDPAQTLAEAAIRAAARAARPLPSPSRRAGLSPARPQDPVRSAVARGRARACGLLLAEHEARMAARPAPAALSASTPSPAALPGGAGRASEPAPAARHAPGPRWPGGP